MPRRGKPQFSSPAGRPEGRSRGPNPGRRPATTGEPAIGWLWGDHAVKAALANPKRRIRRLALLGDPPDWLAEVTLPAHLVPEALDRDGFDKLLPGAVHQGVAVLADPLPELSLHDIIDTSPSDAVLVLLDQVTDPHNVGAILRSAAAFGASAVVLPDRNAAPATGVLAKAASGALEMVPLVRVVNLARALDDLRDADFWCIGLEGTGERTLAQALRPGKVALVLGAEGAGLRRLTGERCDDIAHLPTSGPLASLNVSNAAAIALYAARTAKS